MFYLLSYDVRNDSKRNKICDYLKNCGYHIQKSVFVMDCNTAVEAQKICDTVSNIADLTTDRVLMVPLCNQCFSKAKLKGNYIGFQEDIWIV